MTAHVALTIDEAAQVLTPPVSADQLRQIIAALRWPPAGYRHTGKPGRPVAAYDATRLLQLHAALLPFLPDTVV